MLVPTLEPRHIYGIVMTIEDFSKAIENGDFVDHDGYGKWATGTQVFRSTYVKPSKFNVADAPEGATHVLWVGNKTQRKLKAYYAHCVAIYDTPQEERDVKIIEALGFEVVNPNQPEIKAACDAIKAGGGNAMGLFKPIVEENDVFIFRALPDGSIPSGVAQELEWAQAAGKLIVELPSAIKRRCLDYPRTLEYLAEVGNR